MSWKPMSTEGAPGFSAILASASGRALPGALMSSPLRTRSAGVAYALRYSAPSPWRASMRFPTVGSVPMASTSCTSRERSTRWA